MFYQSSRRSCLPVCSTNPVVDLVYLDVLPTNPVEDLVHLDVLPIQ